MADNTLYEYMVSYWRGGASGNRCGTLAEVRQYAFVNRQSWKSHTFFRFPSGGGISELTEITPEGVPVTSDAERIRGTTYDPQRNDYF